MNTVQLLLRNGVNPEAFRVAFNKIMEENPAITYESIQGIEKKGNDVLITLEVPEDMNKGKIEQQFNEVYEARLEAAKATAKLETAMEYKKDIIDLAKLALNQASNTTIINENKPTAESYKAKYDQRESNIGGIIDTAQSESNSTFHQHNNPSQNLNDDPEKL